MTPVFCCGAECQVLNAAGTHWTLSSTAPTLETTIINPGGGTASYKWAAGASTGANMYIAHTIAQTSVATRFYVYVGAYPSATCTIAQFVNANGGGFVKMSGSGLISVRCGASAADVSTGVSLALNRWYRFDFEDDSSGGTASCTLTIDGANSTSDSHVQVSANLTALRIGPNVTNNSVTTPTIYFDDIIIGALADYPIGPGLVQGFLVGATSGTHSQTAGDFQNDAGTNITNGDGSGAKINEAAADTTSFIKEVALGTAGGYVEYIYNTTGQGFTPRAVEQVVAVKNVSLTTTNNEKSQLYDGTTAADAYALTSIGATTLVYRSKQWSSPPSGGAWTNALLGNLRIRWGFSNDIVPVPAISWTILEIEYAPGARPSIEQDNSFRSPVTINQAVNRATSY